MISNGIRFLKPPTHTATSNHNTKGLLHMERSFKLLVLDFLQKVSGYLVLFFFLLHQGTMVNILVYITTWGPQPETDITDI